MRPTLLSAALSLALTGLLPVHAGSPDPGPADPADPAHPADPSDSTATEFDRITVTATRTERALADVPNTVDIISRERMAMRRTSAGWRAIVIPFRVQGFGPYAEVLQGLEYLADGRGLVPDTEVTAWVRRQAETLRAGEFAAE